MGFLAYRPLAYRVDPDEIVRCPTDGKMNDVDAQFCDQDGTKLAGRLDIDGFTGAPYVPRPYAPQMGETIICPADHKRNDDDAVFCDQDGTKLAGRMDVTGRFVMETKTCPPKTPWGSIDVQTNALQKCYATEAEAQAASSGAGTAAVTGPMPMPPK